MPSTARRLSTIPRPSMHAKPLPRQSPARVHLRSLGGAVALEVGGVVDLAGFKGLLAGSFVVEYINPGFTRAAGGGTSGITIRLRPVPVAKGEAKGKTRPRSAKEPRRSA